MNIINSLILYRRENDNSCNGALLNILLLLVVVCLIRNLFQLQVPQRMFRERVLKFTVFDVHKRQRVVGHATYPLQDHNPEESAYVWRDLERELTDVSICASILEIQSESSNLFNNLSL